MVQVIQFHVIIVLMLSWTINFVVDLLSIITWREEPNRLFSRITEPLSAEPNRLLSRITEPLSAGFEQE